MVNFNCFSEVEIILEHLPMSIDKNLMYDDCKIVHQLNALECIQLILPLGI